jgi:ATP-dependent DNA helicase RecG
MKPDSLITEHSRLIPLQKAALKKLGISTISDLLYHFPTRYGDSSQTQNISSLNKGDVAVIFGKISKLKTSKGFKTKIAMADAWVEDESGKIHCVWFNQPYLAKMTPDGALVRIEGKVSQRKNGEIYFSNPKLEIVNKIPVGVGDSLFGTGGESHTLYPIYPESKGITTNWMYHKIIEVFKSDVLDTIIDPIPKEILDKYSLPSLKTALIWIHTPMKLSDAQTARKRFAFEEIFYIQLEKQVARKLYQKNETYTIEPTEKNLQEFIKRFPFEATDAQQKSISTIISDFKAGQAMSRLLEGDVGSGKTAVAASTAYAVVTTTPKGRKFGNLQVAYMCPTEILATQHFESFIQYFSYLGIQVGLITGSGCRKFPSKINPKGWTDISRTQLLKWVSNGEIPILIGTHALIQKTVKFKNLAYVIIDEQHRFGLKQRASLVQKDIEGKMRAPHLLSMTATPIPRTLALTIYGDLDLTLLDQMPHGRKPIVTEIITPDQRDSIYEKVREELKNGRQAYVICPRIDEPDPDEEMAINAKSVIEESKRLKEKVFKEYTIGILHSKMKPAEKDRVMLDFKSHKIDILCATSVVEVGVNVPNATVIIIEGAERFGLAQLHQLRGRVIRSNNQAYCYVFAETKSDKTVNRLNALKTAKNGFELAEYDLKFRGAGELSGGKQWGVSDIAMEALQNIKMVEAARAEARNIVDTDIEISMYPQVRKELKERKKNITHWE